MGEIVGARRYWADGMTWVCNSGMFVFGIVLAILGAILPALFEEINLEPAQAGGLFLFLNFGSLLVTLGGGPALDRFGFSVILAGCSFVTGGALILMPWAGTYWLLAACVFLLGLGGGGLNVGTNALISDLYPRERPVALNRLGIFFGAGTFFIPFFIGMLLDKLSFDGVLYSAGVIALAPGILFLLLRAPAEKRQVGFPLTEIFNMLKNRFVLLLAILLFFQSGNEISTSGWLTTFLSWELDLTPAKASFYLSAFWGALVLGRLVASWILHRLKPYRLVQAGALLSGLALLVFVLFPGQNRSYLFSAMIGFNMALIFSTVLGQASSRFPHSSGTVMGSLMGVALVGGMTMPWLSGILVGEFSPAAAFIVPLVGFAAVFVLQTVVARVYES